MSSLVATVTAVMLLGTVAFSPEAGAASAAEDGKAVAFDRKKGNCMTCHVMDGATLPGNVGPPLLAMKARFPDKAVLRAQIYDATVINPQSMMPPFGKHRVLTDKEIDNIVEYLYTL
ncbi:MAG: sulfur oxidation c-type cytochrome SoxX [Gammaproteobacteria bacterium]|jgi:sulfur-oxidizing protein SoxX